MKILAIESSCDETACAVVQDGVKILSNVVASSTEMHRKYGGIVPEVAAREQLKCIIPVIKEALAPLSPSETFNFQLSTFNSIDAIAVTVGPGLIGSLLIGVETAKTIAFITGKPIIPVNHVLAHMYANFVTQSVIPSEVEGSLSLSEKISHSREIPPHALLGRNDKSISFPAISLVVSGGHTELYVMKSPTELTWLGGTLDDAAGEAFDKTARLLGFGTGGGLAIEIASKQFSIQHSAFSIHLPRPLMHDKTLNFSFSGLKTAILREVTKLKASNLLDEETINYLANEVQEAISDVLVAKTLNAAKMYDAHSILLSGGVAANIRLREKFLAIQPSNHITIHVPPISLCTDNAVYIGSYAFFRGKSSDWHEITAIPDLSVEY